MDEEKGQNYYTFGLGVDAFQAANDMLNNCSQLEEALNNQFTANTAKIKRSRNQLFLQYSLTFRKLLKYTSSHLRNKTTLTNDQKATVDLAEAILRQQPGEIDLKKFTQIGNEYFNLLIAKDVFKLSPGMATTSNRESWRMY